MPLSIVRFANSNSNQVRCPDENGLVKNLNNLIEQDDRNVKSRLGAMLGLKSFATAATTR